MLLIGRFRSTTSDFHLPIPLISSRGIPAAMALFAALQPKESSEYIVGSKPALSNTCMSLSVNHLCLNGPQDVANSGSVDDLG